MENKDLRSLPVDEVIEKVGVAQACGIKKVASLLFTYRCTIACQHCLFNCSPHQPDVCVSFEDGVEFFRQLRSTDRVIHIAGGEAMMYYRRMMKICKSANEQGFAPHFIETNASWCINDEVTQRRYLEMKQVGIKGIYISADAYHQAFVSPKRRFRAFDWAVKIFGRENVSAGDISLDELTKLRKIGRNEDLLGEYTQRYNPKLIGRAGEKLAKFCTPRPIDELVKDYLWIASANGKGCAPEFDADRMWEIHIDPYGNIQTCCGIIIGNAHEKPLVEWMKQGFHNNSELVKIAYEQGPYGYLEIAIKHGYEPKDGYPQKCNLCWEVRKFLRPYYPETFGPAEIYGG